MPAGDQASADPRLDLTDGPWLCGRVSQQVAPIVATSWRHPIHHQTAMHCIGGPGHIGCNNPPSGPSPMAGRPGLLTNPPLHATSTILRLQLFLKGKIQFVRHPPLSKYRLSPMNSVANIHLMRMCGSILTKIRRVGKHRSHLSLRSCLCQVST